MISFGHTFEESRVHQFPYDSDVSLIAPYWDDKPGDVLYRVSYNQTLLNKVTAYTDDAFNSNSSPSALLIATWNRVPESRNVNNRQFNTFQVVIAADNNNTFVLFLYGDIEWGRYINIGFNSRNGSRYMTIPTNQNLEKVSNIGQQGIFAFKVDQETIKQSMCHLVPVFTIINNTHMHCACLLEHEFSYT